VSLCVFKHRLHLSLLEVGEQAQKMYGLQAQMQSRLSLKGIEMIVI
jgi:hypothetical protein